ncbi:MAG: spore germination protein [Alicyclobacillus sp.]|nr:spore germination protein [Alicyclobacillus sp.]
MSRPRRAPGEHQESTRRAPGEQPAGPRRCADVQGHVAGRPKGKRTGAGQAGPTSPAEVRPDERSFRTITALEAGAVLVSTIIGVGVLALPRFAAEAAGSGAPMVTFCGALLSGIGVVVVTLLGLRFPREHIVLYSERIIGAWPARLMNTLLVFFFAVLTALGAREFSKVVVTAVLERTPIEVTTLTMLLLTALAVRNNMTTFAYIHLFYLPFMLAPGLIIVGLSLKNANSLNLLPVFGNHPDGFFSGVLTVAALFQGSFVMSLVIPYMRHPGKALLASAGGWAVATGLYVLIVIATVAVFGAGEILLLQWPTLDLAKTTLLPGEVLERLDALFLAVWVTAVFTTLYSSYTLVVHGLKNLFRLRDHALWTFAVLPGLFLLAMLPNNLVELYRVIRVVGDLGLILTIGYPALLWMVAGLRKLRSDGRAEDPVEQGG